MRNIVRKTPHFIELSMVKIKATPPGSVTSLRKVLKIKTILNMKKKGYTKKFKKLNILQAEAALERAKYKQLNKAFAKKKTPKEETVILDDTSDRNYSSSSEAENSPDEDEKTSIAYDSESADYNESRNISINRKERS